MCESLSFFVLNNILPFWNSATQKLYLSGILAQTQQETNNPYLTTHLHIIILFQLSVSLFANNKWLQNSGFKQNPFICSRFINPVGLCWWFCWSHWRSHAAADVRRCDWCWKAEIAGGWLASPCDVSSSMETLRGSSEQQDRKAEAGQAS